MLGGTYAHLLVMDYALKPVLANLGATNILTGAYVTDNQITEQDNQTYLLDTDSETRITNQLEQVLKGLYKIQ